jgi:pyruvate/2-oxoglutarate dehydrogenase complex dihydrolipoamide dehydrogenase (E3) component
LDERGYVRVNERLEATTSGVWALGECAGSPQFTHVSEDDSRIIMDNIAGGKRSTRDRLVPYCMFTDPPLAHVGLSDGEAERHGVAARVGRLPTSAVLRAQAIGETQGLMKILVSATDDQILGFTMIGSEAGEVMAAVQTAIAWPIRGYATPCSPTPPWPRDSVSFSPACQLATCNWLRRKPRRYRGLPLLC